MMLVDLNLPDVIKKNKVEQFNYSLKQQEDSFTMQWHDLYRKRLILLTKKMNQ